MFACIYRMLKVLYFTKIRILHKCTFQGKKIKLRKNYVHLPREKIKLNQLWCKVLTSCLRLLVP